MSDDVPAKRRERAKLATFSHCAGEGFKIIVVTHGNNEEIEIEMHGGQVAFLAEKATAYLAEVVRREKK
jgi:hypothetical protein